jgi:Tfp pilus assembly protein PilZ
MKRNDALKPRLREVRRSVRIAGVSFDRMMEPTETRGSHWDRRASGLLRVPFVRACSLALDEGGTDPAFIVNINVLGAYVASDEIPSLGSALSIRFQTADNDQEIVLRGEVSWVNPRQQHPVHSLPPGFGLRFDPIPASARERIESIVRAYTERQQQS